MNRILICALALLTPLSCLGEAWTNPLNIADIYVYGSSDTILVKVSETQVYDTVNNCHPNYWTIIANDTDKRQKNVRHAADCPGYGSSTKAMVDCGMWELGFAYGHSSEDSN